METVKRILHRLLGSYPGSLEVVLWNGRTFRFGDGQPAFTLTFRHPRVLRDLVWSRDPVKLAEAYFGGHVEVSGDFDAALGLRQHLESLRLSFTDKVSLLLHTLSLDSATTYFLPDQEIPQAPAEHQNGRESIAFHYDVSNAFYKLWLDERMVYSCGYFETPEQDINQAQRNKLDHICRKLRLKPNETLLDIGCGWGALVCWAAAVYGVKAHGITLSQNQYDYAQEQIRLQGLQDRVTVELRDYRTLPAAQYDKVVSVGMFEHVGLKNLPLYFDAAFRSVKPGGLFLNHGISTDKPGWNPDSSSRFINRHVFPDGELDTVSSVMCRMEAHGFEIFDVEGLRPHYALTLRQWVKRLEAHAAEAIQLVGERTYRIWRLYMTGCAKQFEQGKTGIYQILAVRRRDGFPALPLTRRDLYN
ncbi:SAM-dependent methyltransferase [Novimethylophilus kurashikiensis]|nr:cyclopropane-fatty-acyl-phospholipid synthase family protein [Novimethylophilus kurashikiensis]